MRCVFLRSIGFCVLWPCMKVSAFRQRRIAADKRALTLVGVRFLFVPRWDIVHYGRDTA